MPTRSASGLLRFGALTLVVWFFAGLLPAQAMLIPCDSPAFTYSPGNWVGDAGRGGSQYRQTWYTGAYWSIRFDAATPVSTMALAFDETPYPAGYRRPQIAYSVDGIWTNRVEISNQVPLFPIKGPGRHEIFAVVSFTMQKDRWGNEGQSPTNVVRFTGLQVNGSVTPVPAPPATNGWALLIGDSITEGVSTLQRSQYSWLLGSSLRSQGWEVGISACGYSGWLARGNATRDVPAYYFITNSVNGAGGEYHDAESRWNKIDGNGHSLLDSAGHLSAYGQVNQEPALILINYGTNDQNNPNHSDLRASLAQSVAALRAAAPKARIVLLVPFGQYLARQIHAVVDEKRKTDPGIYCIDLGLEPARILKSPSKMMGNLHPNPLGHALFAAQILPPLLAILNEKP